MSILTGILKEISLNGSTSTESISKKLGLEVQRVNYHLRYLIDLGLLYRSKRRIFIREGSISSAIEEIRDDVNRIFDCIAKIGEDIDKKLGFENRK
jgi:predicted transcriptional regulator